MAAGSLRSLFFDIGFSGDPSKIIAMDSAADKLKTSMGEAGDKIKSTAGTADGLKSSIGGINGSTTSAVSGIKSIVTALGLVTIAAAGIALIKSSLTNAFDRLDTMAQFNRTMTAITGNSESAGIALDALKGITKGTAYGLDVAAKATQDFVTRGMSTEAATKSVGAWADAVSFYGKGTNEELSNVSDALAKMRTKGTVEMDQLNRLFDSGIDAVGMYAKATGQSSSDVQDALSKGTISSDDFLNTVETAMQTGANGVINTAGAAKQAGASWQGTFDNMRAAATRGMAGIVTSIDTGLTANGLPTLKDMIKDVGVKFEEIAGTIAANMPGMIKTIGDIVNAVTPFAPVFVGIAAALIAWGIANTVFAVQQWFAIVSMSVATGTTAGLTTAQWLLNAALTANPIGIIILAIIGLVAGLIYLWNTNEGFRVAVIAIWEAIKGAFITAWEGIQAAWAGAVQFFSELWAGIVEVANGIGTNIKNAFTDAWDAICAIWGAVVGFFGGIVSGIGSAFSGISGVISGAFDGAMTFLSELPGKFLQWGKDMIQGMIDGINGAIGAVGDAVKGVADKISGFLHFSRPDEGPLHYYESWMPDMMQSLASGITGNVGLIKNALSGLTSDMDLNINSETPNVNMTTARNADSFATVPNSNNSNGGGDFIFAPNMNITIGNGSSIKEATGSIEQQLNVWMEEYANKLKLRNPQVTV